MLFLFVACTPPEPTLTAAPSSGSSSGYYAVSFDLAQSGVSPDAVLGLTVGGVDAYDLQADGDTLTAYVQGAAEPGAAAVELRTAEDTLVFPDVFTYDPPADPVFDRMVAVGASLTMGVESAAITDRSALVGPMAALARAGGAYFALPLLIPDVFAPMTPADVGPPPGCDSPDMSSFTADSATDAIARMVDPETGAFGYEFVRVSPDLVPRDLGVAGMDVHEQVDGPENLAANLLAHLVYDPYGELGAALPASPVQLATEVSPTLIASPDLLGNDVLDAITDGEPFDTSLVTPREDFKPKLEEVVGGLAATGAEVFLANLPSPRGLPVAADRRRQALAAGTATAEDMDAQLAEIDTITADYNQLLVDTAAAYPNVHVVDLAAEVERLRAEPLVVQGETLDPDRFGGLISLDGVHFSDTGYAAVANLFVRAINDTLGAAVPELDLDAVAAADPYLPSALRAAGLDVDACE